MIISFLNYVSKEVLNTYTNKEFINIGSIKDERINQRFYKIEQGYEAYVLALLCSMSALCNFDNAELAAESCLGEEEAQEILHMAQSATILLLDSNLLSHPDKNIYPLAKKLAKHYDLKLIFDNELHELKYEEIQENNNLRIYECLEEDKFIISSSFAKVCSVKENDEVLVKTKNKEFKAKVSIDNNLNAIIALSKKANGYAFSDCVVTKIGEA